jgi:hypothetical protein
MKKHKHAQSGGEWLRLQRRKPVSNRICCKKDKVNKGNTMTRTGHLGISGPLNVLQPAGGLFRAPVDAVALSGFGGASIAITEISAAHSTEHVLASTKPGYGKENGSENIMYGHLALAGTKL